MDRIWSWKDGAPFNADPKEVGERLEYIEEEYEDGVTKENIVDDAQDPDSPLHDIIFRLDDEEAARRWRITVARKVSRNIIVQRSPNEKPVRAFVSINDHDGNRKYKSTAAVLEDEDLRQQALEQVLRSIESLREKHGQFETLADILGEAKREVQSELDEAHVPAASTGSSETVMQ